MDALICKGLCKSFGEKQVLNDFSYTFAPGKVTAVTGPSGCGKTTLANIILGVVKPDSGAVENVPERVSAVFQEDRLIENHSIRANIRFACGNVPGERMEQTLAALGLEEGPEADVSRLSGGMRRRVAIARALILPFDLLVLDEPFKGLDGALKARVMAYTAKCAAGKTVILITHDLSERDAFENCETLEMK